MIREIMGFVAVKTPHPTPCLHPHPDTIEAYQSLRSTSSAWQEAERRFERMSQKAAALLTDLFFAFYDPSSRLDPDVLPNQAWNFSVLYALLSTPVFKEMSEETQGDAVTSALAALHFAEEIVAASLDEGIGRRRLLPWGRAGKHRSRSRNWSRLPWCRIRQEQNDIRPKDLQHTVTAAAARTHRAVVTDQKMRASWSIYPGIRSAHSFDDVWHLLERVRGLSAFEELTQAMHRFRAVLASGSQSVSRRRERLVGRKGIMGYTWGRDLNQAAPEEAVRLVEPIMEDLFVEAYEQRRLLQLAYDDNARRRSGPIVCCMDTSASMNTSAALEWERFLWCKGMGLALLDLARREGRSFLGICFSGEHNVEQFVVTVGGYLPEIAVEMAQCDFNGGTHFERPLQLSVEHIQTHKEKDADLIMITDGEASLKNSFIEEFRRQKVSLGIRLYTVFIDGTHGGLRGISDATFTVRSDRVDSWESAVTEIGRRLK